MKITDEAVEAFRAEAKVCTGRELSAELVRRCLSRALPHLSQGAVRVKPLEWVDLGDGKAFRAFLPVIGGIRIEPYGACGWWEVLWSMPGQCDKLIPDVFDTADEAKAAAQADYERHILSSLSPAPVGVTDEGQLPTRAEAASAAKLLLRCNGFDLEQWGGGDLMDDFPMEALKVLASHEPAPTEKE